MQLLVRTLPFLFRVLSLRLFFFVSFFFRLFPSVVSSPSPSSFKVDRGVTAPGPHVGGEECRDTPLSAIKNVHFTLCQKPWECAPATQKNDRHGLCLSLHQKWHRVRADLEAHLGLVRASTPLCDERER